MKSHPQRNGDGPSTRKDFSRRDLMSHPCEEFSGLTAEEMVEWGEGVDKMKTVWSTPRFWQIRELRS